MKERSQQNSPWPWSSSPKLWRWSKSGLGNFGVWEKNFNRIFCVAMVNMKWRRIVGSVFRKLSVRFEKVYGRQNFSPQRRFSVQNGKIRFSYFSQILWDAIYILTNKEKEELTLLVDWYFVIQGPRALENALKDCQRSIFHQRKKANGWF